MGEISLSARHIDHLLPDPSSSYGVPYHRVYTTLARSHRGRPIPEIVPLLRAATAATLLGFTDADLAEQAQAISSGTPYELRVRVTNS
ncbi:hypothetical protein ACH4M4_37875 [Streptomyces sp. NPDC017254]|uniref:hypothetical protein n=1 Tax=unclassified Streptomyces TaxID=2593676 RepID=UPI003794B62F